MRYAALVLAALSLVSCRYFEDDGEYGYSRTGLTVHSAFTTADERIITERENPVTHQQVVCTEPSPDVAKAISTAFSLSGQGSGGTGQPSGSGSLSGGSAEAVAELAGRSTALLGLRDGLFQACQAFANGAIGADMYALIVSHYGQLMTTLFLGQDISGAPQPVAVATSPGVTVNANPTPGSNSGSGSNVAISAGAPPNSQPGTAPAIIPGAPAAVVRLNEDYLNIDYNVLHMLAVACINQNDPTIVHPPAEDPKDSTKRVWQPNLWLDQVCPAVVSSLATTDGQAAAATLVEGLVKANVLARPVDPTATTAPAPAKAAAAPPAAGSKAKSTAPTCTAVTTAIKAQIVQVLQTLKYLTDDNYSPALNNFETDYGLGETSCPTNQVGQKTLTVIQALAAAEKKKPNG